MSSLLAVVKSHLFLQFVRQNLEIGISRSHWCDGEIAAINREWADTILGSYIHGAAAVAESIAMDGQSIGSKVAAAVTHNSDSQQVYTW